MEGATAPYRRGGLAPQLEGAWPRGAVHRSRRTRPPARWEAGLPPAAASGRCRCQPPAADRGCGSRPRHDPPPAAAAAAMSRKKSGFAITSVRGGNGGGGGEGGDGSGSSSSPGGSRFRLVRLPGPGEALRRGRWICRDFYEREAVPRGSGRVPLSLDSPRNTPPPPFPPSSSSAVAAAAAPSPHQPRSLGAFAQLVQQVRGGATPAGGRGRRKTAPSAPLVHHPPSPLQALPPRPPSPRPGGGTAGLSARLGLAGEEGEEEG